MFRYAFTTPRKQRRGRVSCALLISGLLHLFALLAYERWAAENVERILHPVRFQAVQPALPTDPFKSTPPVFPLTQLERRMPRQPPADPLADAETIDQITPLGETPDSILALRELGFMGEKSAEFEAVRDAYLGKKLKSAGVLGDASSRYNAEVTVKGYYLNTRASIYTINFHLVVEDRESTKPLLDHIVSHKWKSRLRPPIDQAIAERLTSMLIESIGHALASKNKG